MMKMMKIPTNILSSVFLNIPMLKNVDVKYVKFKGPFGSINSDIEMLFKSRNVPNRG